MKWLTQFPLFDLCCHHGISTWFCQLFRDPPLNITRIFPCLLWCLIWLFSLPLPWPGVSFELAIGRRHACDAFTELEKGVRIFSISWIRMLQNTLQAWWWHLLALPSSLCFWLLPLLYYPASGNSLMSSGDSCSTGLWSSNASGCFCVKFSWCACFWLPSCEFYSVFWNKFYIQSTLRGAFFLSLCI